ncbi:hypothetical protein JCGZ_18100 [Jatropha curcas]|uniref:DC1 domain-containing protein n=1 Tax=Jatropha curcas TaxID=180498 RepID=A0A067K2R9_JATCU|nr:hypothetical protein JCGZ_18100 [Jatropha curcas]
MEISHEKDNQKQSKFSIIIAMTGPSNIKKSEISRKIAAFLRYPLIDEEDIIPYLQNFIPSSSIESYLLPFKIASQICSTQLDSKLGVILNTLLSNNTQFNDLGQLAISKDVSLIIIECKTENGNIQAVCQYDTMQVPKISTEITKPFVVEDFVAEVFKAIESHHRQVVDNASKGNVDLIESTFTERHAHEFSLIEDHSISSFEKLKCNCCQQLISGKIYKCAECDEFILHEACAELNHKLIGLTETCPPFLKKVPFDFDFPNQYKCNLCEKFSKFCSDCLLQTHIQSTFLPTIIKYEGHVHALNFIIMPPWVNFQFKCSECDRIENSISYKCYGCNFDFHVDCALLPLRLQLQHLVERKWARWRQL